MVNKRRVAWATTLVLRLSMVTLLASAAPSQGNISALEQMNRPEVVSLKGDVFHVQGLDVDSGFVYVTSVDRKGHRGLLHKFTSQGDLVATVDLTDGPRYHTSGLSLDGQSIWVAVAEYRSGGTGRILQIDKTTLKPVSSFTVNDHVGAVTADVSRVYGVSWDARRLFVWDRAGRLLANVANESRVAYQDLKRVDGHLVASGIIRSQATGAVDWLDLDTLRPTRRLQVGQTESGLVWSREGMTLKNGKLYFLPDDGHDGGVQVYGFDLAQLETTAVAAAQRPIN